ncbi:MAG: hypothetical protein PHG05_00205 [Candidatus Nanoarchaeia archaeon]|nr:hypothetical protein [Candidatus Nanoarchaeia archaeon]
MRHIKRRRYLIAFVITLSVFLLGLLVGFSFNKQREVYLSDIMDNQRLDYDSLQLQYAFIDVMKTEGVCEGITQALSKSVSDLEELRVKIEDYTGDDDFSVANYKILKRDYLLAQIKYWLLNKQSEKVCNEDTVSVLYFYANDDVCKDCSTQSYVLTYLKTLFGEKLLVFSIDSEFQDEPLVGILTRTYNIKEYPTVVVGNDVFPELMDSDKVMPIICNHFKEKPSVC